MPFNALAGHWDWSSAVVGLVSTLGLRGAPLLSNPLIGDAVKLMLLGSIIETGKRIIQWISERFEPSRFEISYSPFESYIPTIRIFCDRLLRSSR